MGAFSVKGISTQSQTSCHDSSVYSEATSYLAAVSISNMKRWNSHFQVEKYFDLSEPWQPCKIGFEICAHKATGDWERKEILSINLSNFIDSAFKLLPYACTYKGLTPWTKTCFSVNVLPYLPPGLIMHDVPSFALLPLLLKYLLSATC